MKKNYIKIAMITLLFIVIAGLSSEKAVSSELNAEKNSIVRLKIKDSKGNLSYKTGFAVGRLKEGSERYIITVKEGIEKAKNITTEFNGLRPIELKVKKVSDKTNMAVLSISMGSHNDFKPLTIKRTAKIEAGKAMNLIGFSDDYSEEVNRKQIVISSTDSRSDFKAFSFAEELSSEVYYGSPVFDEKNNVVGMVTSPDPAIQDRSDIIYIDYIASVLSDGLYEEVKDSGQFYAIVGSISVVVLLMILGIFISVGKKKKQERLSKKEAPVDHSDGKTVAIIPNKAQKTGGLSSEGLGIIGVTGYFAGRKFGVEKHIIIGRDSKKVQIIFPDKTMGVSAVHCELRNVNGALMITDLGSSYGTFLSNGMKLVPSSPHLINIGDEFYLGAVENKFKVVS